MPSVKREPLFNIPAVVLTVIVVLAAVHLVRVYMLTDEQDLLFVYTFAFIPARYDVSALGAAFPGGFGAEVWTFATYALIHADWTHLAMNSLWLLPFGSAVARRFGPLRFLVFFAVTAAAGALAFLLTEPGGQALVIGASASISGTMAAAMRFAFQRGGPLSLLRIGDQDERTYRIPAVPLSGILSDGRVVIFLLVWFGVNLLFGLGALSIGGGDQPVAWQAHIGGFLAGLLLFSWFDPPPPVQTDEFDAMQY